MKVFIVTDLEGVSGCTSGGYGFKLNSELQTRYHELMMGEINAVVEGCVQSGAGEIIIGEAHSIDLARLHPEAKLARGLAWHNAPAIRDFDAVLFVGQHARTNLADAVRSHTGSSKSIVGFWINDRPAGELAYIGGLFGEKNVPVIFLSGDDAACREAEEWATGITTVAVEEALSVWGAVCLPPAKTRPLLVQGVINAFINKDNVRPIKITVPATVKIEFAYPQIADAFCVSPGSKRLDARTVSYSADTYKEAYIGSIAVLGNVLYKYDS
jgi:D-amino peptidase